MDMTGQVTRLGLVSSLDAQMDPMLVEEPRQKILQFIHSSSSAVLACHCVWKAMKWSGMKPRPVYMMLL